MLLLRRVPLPPPAPARQPPPASDEAFASPAPDIDSLAALVPRVNWPAVALPAIILTLMLLLCSGMSLYGIVTRRQVLRRYDALLIEVER
jgi:hypothetical protein